MEENKGQNIKRQEKGDSTWGETGKQEITQEKKAGRKTRESRSSVTYRGIDDNIVLWLQVRQKQATRTS